MPDRGVSATSEEIRQVPRFSPWVGGYSRAQVDAFVERLARLLAAYEKGTVTNPEFTSEDLKRPPFRLAPKGYKPDQVEAFMVQVVDTLRSYELANGVDSRKAEPNRPGKPGHLPGVFGASLLGALAAGFIMPINVFDPEAGDLLRLMVIGGVAVLAGRFVYKRHPATPLWPAVGVGTLGWLLGSYLGSALRVMGTLLSGL